MTLCQLAPLSAVLLLVSARGVSGATHYVNVNNTTPLPPYTSWATAATNIQNAIDVAVAGEDVLVTDGVYSAGGRAVFGTMTNRVAVNKPLHLHSVNGPQATVIEGRQLSGPAPYGNGAIRCVYLTNGASLSGFTLTNGATRAYSGIDRTNEGRGAGLWCASQAVAVSNCVIVGNAAWDAAGGVYSGSLYACRILTNYALFTTGGAVGSKLDHCVLMGNHSVFDPGGGASSSQLENCLLIGNSATSGGGGANSSTLIGCTLAGNSVETNGGGAFYCNLSNCIAYLNTSSLDWTSNYHLCTFEHCCTAPQPAGGNDNISADPLFLDLAGANFRLQSNSPCINSGNNSYVHSATDLDGRPRVVNGTVAMGAYEFQPAVNGQFMSWLQQYGLPTDGSADDTDPDGDGMNNWQEWRCQTNPTNAPSVLRMISASRSGNDVTVRWQSVAGVNYFLERSTNLAAVPPFTALATSLPGQPGTTTYTNPGASAAPLLFYRVGVGN